MWAVENRRLTSQISITWTFESDLAAWMNNRNRASGNGGKFGFLFKDYRVKLCSRTVLSWKGFVNAYTNEIIIPEKLINVNNMMHQLQISAISIETQGGIFI